MNWSNRIKQLREEKELTQKELADMLNINEKTIYRYETGIYEPSASALIKLSQIFNVSIDYLLGKSPMNVKNLKDELERIDEEIKKIIKSL